MHAARSLATLAVILAGATAFEGPSRDPRPQQGLDLLRILLARPWLGQGPHDQWDRPPRVDAGFGPKDVEIGPELGEDDGKYVDDIIRTGSGAGKRSAVATALNAGRRRRQPSPALGKAVIPFAGVGVLNDMGTFFDSLRDNLETLASLSPEERAMVFQGPPTVVHAPQAGGGGGSGFRKLHALRPLRPTGNIRSYNRRSLEADYPGANHHDPGLLWTGLGR